MGQPSPLGPDVYYVVSEVIEVSLLQEYLEFLGFFRLTLQYLCEVLVKIGWIG